MMRIIIHSGFPLIDQHFHKKWLLLELASRREHQISELVLVYSNTRPAPYFREYKRNSGLLASLERFLAVGATRKGSMYDTVESKRSAVPKGLLSKLARQNQIQIRYFPRLADPGCLDFARSFQPDVTINLSGIYVPRELLSLPKLGVLSGHYALLPSLRGGDTIRWTIWLDQPMVVSHMFLAPELDMGEILRTISVPVERGDTILSIRKKCQMVAVEGQLEMLDAIALGRLERRPQKKTEGSVFYMMGKHLRTQVDKKLTLGLYKHYVNS